LRKLLNADSKDTTDLMGGSNIYHPHHHQRLDSSSARKFNSYSGGLYPTKNYQQLTVHPEPQSDVSVFFPSAFLSPQSLPPHLVGDDDDIYSFNDELTDDYTISPPAEYAANDSPTGKVISSSNR
jgi:hypothetical protein